MHVLNPIEQRSRDRGFSLVELLVVVLIIGTLAAIAIPVYLSQRSRAMHAGEKADARSLATQMETYYVDAHRYPEAGELTWSAGERAVQFGAGGDIVRLSGNNQARVLRTDSEQKFCIEVRNIATSTTAVYESGGGGLQRTGVGAACPAAYDATVLAFPAG